MTDCGIYLIKNTKTKKVYVGSSTRMDQRWYEHKRQLNNNKHHSAYLQHSWNKHTFVAFEFEKIERCLKEDLYKREAYWIEHYKSYQSEFGYNMTKATKGRFGHTQRTRNLISSSAKANIKANPKKYSHLKPILVYSFNNNSIKEYPYIQTFVNEKKVKRTRVDHCLNDKVFKDYELDDYILVHKSKGLKKIHQVYLHSLKVESNYFTSNAVGFYGWKMEDGSIEYFESKNDFQRKVDRVVIQSIAKMLKSPRCRGYLLARTKEEAIERGEKYIKMKARQHKRKLIKFYVQTETRCTMYTDLNSLHTDNPQFSESGVELCLAGKRGKHKNCVIQRIPSWQKLIDERAARLNV